MEQLISMYAALQKNPVTVSYPDGQASPNDFDYAYGYYNDFITIYTFGPYKLEHNNLARSKHYIKGCDQELTFTKPGKHFIDRCLSESVYLDLIRITLICPGLFKPKQMEKNLKIHLKKLSTTAYTTFNFI